MRSLLESADAAGLAGENDQAILAIVSPHAGYVYSGATAAFGYQKVKRATQEVKRVFLLGPSHHVAFNGVALPSASSFATPLGTLEVDSTLISELEAYPLFTLQPEVHRLEHSLELQLPFIKTAFGEVKIVPLVIGTLTGEAEIRLVAEILKGFVQKTDLVIVSSDFTHYGPRYDYQPFLSDIMENIEKLDREAFQHLSRADLPGWLEFQERTRDTICGFFPCAVLCAMLPKNVQANLLKYSTSSDVPTNKQNNNSVSYLSIGFSGESWPVNPQERKTTEETINLSNIERATLMEIARRSLSSFVLNKQQFDAERHGLSITSNLQKCFGAFVTLYQKPATAQIPMPEKELRGCIGSIWPVLPLWKTVLENAVASGSRDPRFVPVEGAELADLIIEISVLTPPRRVQSHNDIVIGTDGIILSKNNRQSVFLPVVATECGWSLTETLRELCLKAGLKEDDWKDGAKFDVFQSLTIKE